MQEIEISSWLTLDALKNQANILDSVGDLQNGHSQSIFCTIEDDLLELCYTDTETNFLRTFDNKEEIETAIDKRKEELGDAPYEEEGLQDEIEEIVDEDEESAFPDDEENF